LSEKEPTCTQYAWLKELEAETDEADENLEDAVDFVEEYDELDDAEEDEEEYDGFEADEDELFEEYEEEDSAAAVFALSIWAAVKSFLADTLEETDEDEEILFKSIVVGSLEAAFATSASEANTESAKSGSAGAVAVAAESKGFMSERSKTSLELSFAASNVFSNGESGISSTVEPSLKADSENCPSPSSFHPSLGL
jgi:hypothetical protein